MSVRLFFLGSASCSASCYMTTMVVSSQEARVISGKNKCAVWVGGEWGMPAILTIY